MSEKSLFPIWEIFKLSHSEAWRYIAQNPVAVFLILGASQALTMFYETQIGQINAGFDLALKLSVMGIWLLAALSIGFGAFLYWQTGEKLPYIPFWNLFNKAGLKWGLRITPYMLLTMVLMTLPMIIGFCLSLFSSGFILGPDEALRQLAIFQDFLISLQEKQSASLQGTESLAAIILIGTGIFTLPGIILTLRLSPIIAAGASRHSLSIAQAWRKSKGRSCVIAFTILFAVFPTAPWAFIFAEMRLGQDGIVYHLFSLIVIFCYLINGVINAAVTILVWHHLEGWPLVFDHSSREKR